MTEFFEKAKDMGFCIKEEKQLICIEGNWTNQYNRDTGEFNEDCPINVTGGEITLDNDILIVEKTKGLHVTLKHRNDGNTRSIEYSW